MPQSSWSWILGLWAIALIGLATMYFHNRDTQTLMLLIPAVFAFVCCIIITIDDLRKSKNYDG